MTKLVMKLLSNNLSLTLIAFSKSYGLEESNLT